MVTTGLDFMHLRTTTGLARQARRHARILKRKKFWKHAEDWKKKIKEGINRGLIDEVLTSFMETFKIEEKEEHHENIIFKDDVLLLHEKEKQQNKEHDFIKKLEKVLTQIAKEEGSNEWFSEFNQKVLGPLKEEYKDLGEAAGKITKLIDDIIHDREQLLAMKGSKNVLLTKKMKFRKMQTKEGLILGEEYKNERDYDHCERLLYEIEKIINTKAEKTGGDKSGFSRKDQIKKKLEELYKFQGEFFQDIIKEAGFLVEVITLGANNYVEIMNDVKGPLRNLIVQLKTENFPLTEYKKIEKKEIEIYETMNTHLLNLFKLAYYEQRHTGGSV
ncbi:MAG: hypothetical protein KKF46_03540 [Nanoarchaeota archaeon]|nr:hypothetical protein [Nanoarchaeota archaeon]MBU1321408.1 hypothetical protein [Nanoarchaeota archaeon]MBU1597887.1 hypothetical protein [Nanoarchaeota archaeon]MBU2442268.1 hypothetical protein [Nanoarchaeota archaeon]